MTVSPGKAANSPDEQQFRAIFVEYGEVVYGHALRLLGDPEEAADAAQEVFVRVYRSHHKFRGESQFSTWLFRIVFNVCSSRRKRRQKRLARRLIGVDDAAPTLVDPDGDPAAEYEKKEERERLRRFVALLPEKQARMVTMFFFDGLDYREIAAFFKTSPGTVASNLSRARTRLSTLLTRKKGVNVR